MTNDDGEARKKPRVLADCAEVCRSLKVLGGSLYLLFSEINS